MSPLRRLLNRLKPRSAVWRTTLVVGLAVVVSQYLSIAFFWTNLYLPEIRQHALYTAVFVRSLRQAQHQPEAERYRTELEIKQDTGLIVVRDPSTFPNVYERPLADFFTAPFAEQLSRELGESADVHFGAKPTPRIWISIPSMPHVWIREPLVFYAQYNPFIIVAWIFGVPLLTVLSIVILVRQLNRPLKRLQLAALRVGRGQHSTMLDEKSGPLEFRSVNRAFNQMTREIQQASRERAVMLAGISHDLRTPLTRLRLGAEMMRDRDIAEGMVLDIQDMDAILDQFIAYMRDGSDEPVEMANLNLLLSEVVAQFSTQGDVRFAPEPLPDVPMRRLSLKRMLGNLISNALRHGGAPVEITTSVIGRELQIRVRDHGPGIEEDMLPELLQPFIRGESARTTQGSGLGLAIVARVVKLHQGRLDIRNHALRGLIVTIHLPLDGNLSKNAASANL